MRASLSQWRQKRSNASTLLLACPTAAFTAAMPQAGVRAVMRWLDPAMAPQRATRSKLGWALPLCHLIR